MYDLNEEIAKAKKVDPDLYLQSKGFEVKKEGRHYSIKLDGQEIYRTTRKDDGHFVTCDKMGNGIGDNISLVKNIEGCNFKDAISILNKITLVNNIELNSNVNSNVNIQNKNIGKKEYIKLPKDDINVVNNGRKYLLSRGIDLEIILKAEKSNFLKYAENSVFFVGYDQNGSIKNVTKRSTNINDEIQKRDLKGSDKYYPQILEGSDKSVWIVEGGVDALALQNLAKINQKELPTVFVTGGANVLSLFQNPEVQDRIQKAERIVLSLENEKNLKVQETTGKAHQKQFEALNKIAPNKKVTKWIPPLEFKDIAEMNQKKKLNSPKIIEEKNNISLKQKSKLKLA